jgi:hypothetical protein
MCAGALAFNAADHDTLDEVPLGHKEEDQAGIWGVVGRGNMVFPMGLSICAG